MRQYLGLALSGRQPLAQPSAGSFTNQVGAFQPGQALGFNQGVFGSQANIFGSQAGMFNNQSNIAAQPAPWEGIVGSLAGGVGSGIGFGLGKKFG